MEVSLIPDSYVSIEMERREEEEISLPQAIVSEETEVNPFDHEVFLAGLRQVEQQMVAAFGAPMADYEQTVRKALVEIWTNIVKKYADGKAVLPSPDKLRAELLKSGVDAGVKAVVKHHWFVVSGMVRGKIHDKVSKGLNHLNMREVVDRLKAAQKDKKILQEICEQIRQIVLFNRF